MPDEEKLLVGARRYDEDALAAIYDKYSPGLYRYAFRHCGDVSKAEDCVAETFRRFLETLGKGGGPRKHLQAYLYRTAHNWITDSYRREPPPEEEFADKLKLVEKTGPDESVDAATQNKTIRAALENLTQDQQQVIILKFLEGWSNKEIAESLQKPVGAVKALQSRGLSSLRRILQDEKHSL